MNESSEVVLGDDEITISKDCYMVSDVCQLDFMIKDLENHCLNRKPLIRSR
jgi:hypothetical protein